MKKILKLTLVLVLALTLAACGGGSNPADDPSSGDGSNVSDQSSSNSGGTVTDGMSDKLAGAYIDMISGGVYYMKYRSSQEYEGERTDAVAEFAVNGDDTAMIYEMESASMHMVVKESKTYIVNDEEKTVMVMSAGSTEQGGAGAFPKSEFVFKGSGTGELFGTQRPYEEYSTDGGDVRFFFNDSKLAGFESSTEGMTVQMEILEMSEKIPAGMFDIPDGYEVTEF